jgi:hypothetical protein
MADPEFSAKKLHKRKLPSAQRILDRALQRWSRDKADAVRYLATASSNLSRQAWAKLLDELPAEFAQLARRADKDRPRERWDETVACDKAAYDALVRARHTAFWKDLQSLSTVAETRDDVIALIPQALDLVLRHYPENSVLDDDLIDETLSELSCPLVAYYGQKLDEEAGEEEFYTEFNARGYENASLAAYLDVVEQAMAEMWELMHAEIERRGLVLTSNRDRGSGRHLIRTQKQASHCRHKLTSFSWTSANSLPFPRSQGEPNV